GSSPKPFARDASAFNQRGDLRPGDEWMHLIVGASGGEPAVVRSDDAVSPDHARVAFDPLRHELRVLDQSDPLRNHPWNENLVARDLHVLADGPFVIMSWIGCLERVALCVDGHHQVQIVLQFEVASTWSDVG